MSYYMRNIVKYSTGLLAALLLFTSQPVWAAGPPAPSIFSNPLAITFLVLMFLLLIVIGIQLVKITHIETARRTGDLGVYLVTVLGVVFLNLLNGVLLGLAAAILMTLWRVAHAQLTAEPTGENQWQVNIDGVCTFLSLPQLHQALDSVAPGSRVSMLLSATFIDHAAREFIDEWRRQHEAGGGTVTIELEHVGTPAAMASL